MKRVLSDPLSQLQETAKHIADISNECKLPLLQDEYVETFKPTLMDVVHAWSKVSTSLKCKTGGKIADRCCKNLKHIKPLHCQAKTSVKLVDSF